MLVARNASELSQVGDDIRALNSKVQVLEVSADVTSEESIKALWAKVKENFGSADVLVNNAGTFVGSGTLAEAPPKEWWRDFVSQTSLSYHCCVWERQHLIIEIVPRNVF